MHDQLDDQHIIPVDDLYYQQQSLNSNNQLYHDITAGTHRIHRQKQSISWSSLLWSGISWLVYLTMIATFVASLLISYQYHQDPCEHPLSVIAAIVGVTGLIWVLVIPYQVQLEEHAPPTWETACFRLTCCLRLIVFLVLLTTAIIGSIWTFSMSSTAVCPHPLYIFTYYFLIAWWCLVGVGLMIVILIAIMCIAFMR